MSYINALQYLDNIDIQFAELQKHLLYQKMVDLNNQLVRDMLKWHTLPDDPRRLWHDQNGNLVTVTVQGKTYHVCEHPWLPGVNANDDISLSYAFNYHRKFIDWRAWLRSKLLLADV